MRKDKPNITYDELYEKLSIYIISKSDLKLISKAYLFAYEKHFGQKRLSGEDYIVHPLNVAYILSEINADYQTICAALLHDVLEDTDTPKDEIVNEFGIEIASLVDGVTKINKLNFSGSNEAVSANHRKILVGLTEDVRVIIIKLADRLHNMRTMWVLSSEKQKENAKETLDILIPIAHRLGMNKIKSELEDLSLRYLKPDVYFSIVEKLNQTKKDRDKLIDEMIQEVSLLLNEHGIKHEIKGRSKSIYSIYKKLDTGRRFSDIYDLLALRVFVSADPDCYQVMGLIHSKYRAIPKRFKDFVAMPKQNGYQSLHTTVFGVDGNLFEIQVRTYAMDQVAEHGVASHWSYKEHNKTIMQSAMEEKLQFFRSIVELQKEDDNDEDFVKNVKDDVLNKIIYVFTPKGDVIELPVGSTPIDFAYKVHTKVGDSMVGAIVNGSIVPLDYKLNDNDIVRINTNRSSLGPSKEWINIAFTAQAKNKIKAFFNKIDKEELIKKGEELLNKELRKKKISAIEFLSDENIDKILNEFKLANLTELYINLGSGKNKSSQFINYINNSKIDKEEFVLKKVLKPEIQKPVIKNDIIVDGIDDIKVHIASCCKPMPNDSIVGYISNGNGINIHRSICPNISDLNERIIDVKWNEDTNNKYCSNIVIQSIDNKKILLDVIAKTSNNDIIIQSINSVKTNDNYLFYIGILVSDIEKLNKFMNDIKMINSVIYVERVIK